MSDYVLTLIGVKIKYWGVQVAKSLSLTSAVPRDAHGHLFTPRWVCGSRGLHKPSCSHSVGKRQEKLLHITRFPGAAVSGTRPVQREVDDQPAAWADLPSYRGRKGSRYK